jgi:hypothetical protein
MNWDGEYDFKNSMLDSEFAEIKFCKDIISEIEKIQTKFDMDFEKEQKITDDKKSINNEEDDEIDIEHILQEADNSKINALIYQSSPIKKQFFKITEFDPQEENQQNVSLKTLYLPPEFQVASRPKVIR